MLKQRLIFGALGIILTLVILIYGSTEFIGCAVGVLALIAMYEFYKVTGLLEKKSPMFFIGLVFTALIFSVSIFLREKLMSNLMLIIVSYIFVLMCTMVLLHGKCSFNDLALSFVGSAYVGFFFLHILFIRQLTMGELNIWLIFITAWSSDTFAYFAGRLFGKHKLCPNISPKKTVEGAIGGIVGSIICICIYVFCCSKFTSANANYVSAVVFAIVCAVFSQVGDLAASCIKRENNVKDYGNLIPGHGGILDRFDSALLIAPLVYYFIKYYPVIF